MRKITSFITIIVVILVLISFSIDVNAHEYLLDIEYENCNSTNSGINEWWYYLCEKNYSKYNYLNYYHISHNKTTLKYYFSPTSRDDSTYTWTTKLSASEAQEIQNAFADSMKKWNSSISRTRYTKLY